MARTRRPALAREGRSIGRSIGRSRRRMPVHTRLTSAAGLLRTASAALLGGLVGVVLDALLQGPSRPRRPRPADFPPKAARARTAQTTLAGPHKPPA
jgi:hypothetical protein